MTASINWLSRRFQRLQAIDPRTIEWVAPKLLPDEFILGWLNRFAEANCHDNAWEFVQAVTSFIKETRSEGNDTYYISSLVSDFAGIAFSELDKFHTLHPWFQFCGTNSIPKELHPSAQNRSYVRMMGIYSAFCQECIEEDKCLWGWVYWRRSHQVPGVTTCLKHEIGLHFAPSRCFTAHSPLSASPKGKPCPDTSSFGKRYSEIAVGMLEEATLGAQQQTREKLMALVQARTGDAKFESLRTYLAAAGEVQIPETWVEHACFDKLTKKSLIKELCCRFPQQFSPVHVAIALALLFDDADQALLFWATQNSQFALAGTLAAPNSTRPVH